MIVVIRAKYLNESMSYTTQSETKSVLPGCIPKLHVGPVHHRAAAGAGASISGPTSGGGRSDLLGLYMLQKKYL